MSRADGVDTKIPKATKTTKGHFAGMITDDSLQVIDHVSRADGVDTKIPKATKTTKGQLAGMITDDSLQRN